MEAVTNMASTVQDKVVTPLCNLVDDPQVTAGIGLALVALIVLIPVLDLDTSLVSHPAAQVGALVVAGLATACNPTIGMLLGTVFVVSLMNNLRAPAAALPVADVPAEPAAAGAAEVVPETDMIVDEGDYYGAPPTEGPAMDVPSVEGPAPADTGSCPDLVSSGYPQHSNMDPSFYQSRNGSGDVQGFDSSSRYASF